MSCERGHQGFGFYFPMEDASGARGRRLCGDGVVGDQDDVGDSSVGGVGEVFE